MIISQLLFNITPKLCDAYVVPLPPLGMPSRTVLTLYSQQPGNCVSRNCEKSQEALEFNREKPCP